MELLSRVQLPLAAPKTNMKKTLKFLLITIILLGVAGYILVGPLAFFANRIYVEVYDESVPADFSAELDQINQEYSKTGGHIYFEHVKVLISSKNKLFCLPTYPEGFPQKDVCFSGESCQYTYGAEDKAHLLENGCPFYIASAVPSSELFGALKYKLRILTLGKKYNIKVGARPFHSF